MVHLLISLLGKEERKEGKEGGILAVHYPIMNVFEPSIMINTITDTSGPKVG